MYLRGEKYVSKKSHVRNEPGTYRARTATAHTENEIKILVNSNWDGVSKPSTSFRPWGVLREVWDLFRGLYVKTSLVCSASSWV